MRLRPGRYKMYAVAPGYEEFSSCCGFLTFQGDTWQQSNIPLVPTGPICNSEGRYGGSIGYDPADWEDRAPTVRIEANPCSQSWEVSFSKPGRYVLLANARDDAYPNGDPHLASSGLGMGCVEILVTED